MGNKMGNSLQKRLFKFLIKLITCERVLLLSVFLTLIYSSSASAQIDTTENYPLKKGNRWEYFNLIWEPNFYTRAILEVEDDTVMDNGKKYTRIKETVYNYDNNYVILFKDISYSYKRGVDNKYVYEYFANNPQCSDKEDLVFDFTASVGTLWPSCNRSNGIQDYYGVQRRGYSNFGFHNNLPTYQLAYNVTLKESNGKIDTVWSIVDASNYHVVLKGIGMIRFCETFDLKAYLINGEQYGTFTNVSVKTYEAPLSFTLKPAYPNPFNPSTNITFSLPEAGEANLTIYDNLGRQVSELVNDYMVAGSHIVKFTPGGALPSGIYFIRLQQGKYLTTSKVIFQK